MKALADIVAGLWSALCIGVTLLWEGGVKWWSTATLNKRTAVVMVVALLLLFGMSQCVRAQPNAESGYSLVMGEVLSAACYVENGVPETGVVVPCLVGPNTPNGLLVNGSTVFCTITGLKETVPVWSCAATYQETRDKITGI